MKKQSAHIFPVHETLLQRRDKERLLKQKGIVVWMTGLSGSGKTTIARLLEKTLHEKGFLTQVLDGDNVRSGLNGNLGFSENDRRENIRRIAEVSKLFLNSGIITINCFVSPARSMRALAREIIGATDFVEVFVNAPLAVCESRDVKGLYAKARKGEISDFTGISAPFEAPESPDMEITTANASPEKCSRELFLYLLPRIKPGSNEAV